MLKKLYTGTLIFTMKWFTKLFVPRRDRFFFLTYLKYRLQLITRDELENILEARIASEVIREEQ